MPPTLKTGHVNEHVFHAGIAPLLNLHFRSRLLAGFLAALLHVPGLSYGLAGSQAGWAGRPRAEGRPSHPFILSPFHLFTIAFCLKQRLSPLHPFTAFTPSSCYLSTIALHKSNAHSFIPSPLHTFMPAQLSSCFHIFTLPPFPPLHYFA